MTKLIWLIDWVLDDGKDALSEDVAAWRASVYRWIMIALFSVGGAWLVWFVGDYAASRAAQPFEGLGTIVWVGDASTSRNIGTAYKGGANGQIDISRDGALVLVDGFPEPVMFRTTSGTLTRWLRARDRVRVKYKRGSFLFWQNMDVTKIMILDDPQPKPPR